MVERDIVINQFKSAFEPIKHEPIVLYGLGKYTKLIVESCPDYNIIGLMGGEQSQGELYGKTLLSIKNAEEQARYIVIIARKTSVRAIYFRIREMEKQGVIIVNYAGQLLKEFYCNVGNISHNPYWNENFLKLQTTMGRFYSIKICAYGGLFMSDFLSDEERETTRENANKAYICRFFPRKEIYELITKYGNTKEIMIAEDAVLSMMEIQELLRKYPLQTEYTIISNNETVDKKDVLYIGRAVDNGCKERLITLDGYEVLRQSEFEYLLDSIRTQGDRKVLSHFLCCFFNSPYSLSAGRGKFSVSGIKELTGSVFGPLVLGFLSWLYKKAEISKPDSIFFLARDGYFIERVYQKYKRYFLKKNTKLPEGNYILASRRALAVPCIHTEEDIVAYLFTPAVDKGTFGEILEIKYGVKPAENDNKQDINSTNVSGDELKEYILSYRSEILNHAGSERCEYLKYLEEYNPKNKNIWIFDLVTAGTAFRFMSRLLYSLGAGGAELVCFQYLATETYHAPGPYCSYFEDGNYYEDKCAFSTRFPLCEVAFSPGIPMFLYFDQNHKPVYNKIQKEAERMQNEDKIELLQKEVISWLDDFHEKVPDCFELEYSQTFIDSMYRLMDPSFSDTEPAIKELFVLENYWQNADEANLWKIFVDESVKGDK